MCGIAAVCYLSETPVPTQFLIVSPPPPLLPNGRAEFCPMTTPKLASNGLDMRLLGNFPVSQVAGCRCTLLAGNSSTSLAGSGEQINFYQKSSKMLKKASESFIHALLLFSSFFFSKFPLGAPENGQYKSKRLKETLANVQATRLSYAFYVFFISHYYLNN